MGDKLYLVAGFYLPTRGEEPDIIYQVRSGSHADAARRAHQRCEENTGRFHDRMWWTIQEVILEEAHDEPVNLYSIGEDIRDHYAYKEDP